MTKLDIKNCNVILTERLLKYQWLSCRKIDKYQYLTCEEILPSDQQRVIE